MNTKILLLIITLFPVILFSFEEKGDSIIVQTFTFNDPSPEGWSAPYKGRFTFPEKNDWYKIWMITTLKCDVSTKADSLPCGEWDYFTHTAVYVPAGDTLEMFEIGSFITPYGIRLNLGGEEGWAWVYDVTDYSPILHGDLLIETGNNQELLDQKFIFVKGVPPRKCLDVRNIYSWGLYSYRELAEDSVLTEIPVSLLKEAESFMLKARISGHGHNGPYNCCEWMNKTHSYFINGGEAFRWNVWKNCGDNPLYPQGGTWPFDRAGWCPGTKVDEYDFDITPYVSPGDTIVIDYEIENTKYENEGGGEFRMAHQLFSYSGESYNNDAAIEEIIKPNKDNNYSRFNPTCSNPEIIIRNTGRNTLKSLTIDYRIKDQKKQTLRWRGNLGFLQSEKITLPAPEWLKKTDETEFIVELSFPYGTDDECAINNFLSAQFELPQVLPQKFILKIETNNLERAKENSFSISNSEGNIFYSRDHLEDDKIYEETIELSRGCYELNFEDLGQDGISIHWWHYRTNPEMVGKSGKISILDLSGAVIRSFPSDFGEYLSFSFIVR